MKLPKGGRMDELELQLSALTKVLRAACEGKIGKLRQNPLSGKLDYVMPDPYPPGASPQLIAGFTRRTGIQLPIDVVKWLRISNGAAGFFGIKAESEGRDIEWLWRRFHPVWRKKRWIPIGSDGFGNFYVRVATRKMVVGVYFVEGMNSDELGYAVASDTLHFVQFSLDNESRFAATSTELSYPERFPWPFDKRFVLAHDPNIVECRAAPLPWETAGFRVR